MALAEALPINQSAGRESFRRSTCMRKRSTMNDVEDEGQAFPFFLTSMGARTEKYRR